MDTNQSVSTPQTEELKKCRKKARKILAKYPTLYFVALFIPLCLIHSRIFILIYLVDSPKEIAGFLIPLMICMIPMYIMLFLCLYYAAFPLKFKNGKRIRSWGDELEILRLILAEFSDKTNPPKKSLHLWATSHFVILLPYSYIPKIYYLPLLTDRVSKPGGRDILYFSDGEKIRFKKICKSSRKLLEEAVADYF